MGTLLRVTFIIFVALVAYFTFMPNPHELSNGERELLEELKRERQETRNPKPEPGRKIHHFDWEQNKYIYTDEVEPEKVLPPLQRKLEYMPDYSVEVEPSSDYVPEQKIRYVVIDGKRYKAITKPNGTIELREWR